MRGRRYGVGLLCGLGVGALLGWAFFRISGLVSTDGITRGMSPSLAIIIAGVPVGATVGALVGLGWAVRKPRR